MHGGVKPERPGRMADGLLLVHNAGYLHVARLDVHDEKT